MDQDPNAPPLNPLPPVVWALVLPLILIEAGLNLGGRGIIGGPQAIGWRIEAVDRFAFAPELMRHMVEVGSYRIDILSRLISYPLVHASFTHALFAVVILLALGKMVGDIFRWWAVLTVVFGSAIVGALAYGFLVPDLQTPLIGAYPPVYGLIGAFTFLLWTNLARTGANKYRAFALIGVLLVLQVVIGAMGFLFQDRFSINWEWVADLSGFATGFMLSFVVSPGGFRHVLRLIRQR